MAANEAVWNGVTLMGANEGVFSFKRGAVKPVIVTPRPARSRGNVGKEIGAEGAEHTLHLVFTEVATANVEAIFDRIQNAALPSNGPAPSGTLVLYDEAGAVRHSLARCMLVDWEPVSEERRSTGGSAANPAGTGIAWELQFDLKFKQLGVG